MPVRLHPNDINRGQIIAGSRRLRAATAVGSEDIPIRLMRVDDAGMVRLAAIENLHRHGLNMWEEGRAVRQTQVCLADLGQSAGVEDAGEVLGLGRGTAYNRLKLYLRFPADRLQEAGYADLSLGACPPGLKSIADVPQSDLLRLAQIEDESERLAALRELSPKSRGGKRDRAAVFTVKKDPVTLAVTEIKLRRPIYELNADELEALVNEVGPFVVGLFSTLAAHEGKRHAALDRAGAQVLFLPSDITQLDEVGVQELNEWITGFKASLRRWAKIRPTVEDLRRGGRPASIPDLFSSANGAELDSGVPRLDA